MAPRHRSGLLLLITATTLSATSGARADDGASATGLGAEAQPAWLQATDREQPPPDAPLPNSMQWYGWQTLIADGVTVGSLTTAAVIRDESAETAFARFAVGSFVLGPAVVHAVHGRWGPALGSLALRVAPFALGAATLNCAFSRPFSSGSGGGTCSVLAALTVVSIAVPVVLDTGFFAWERSSHTREPTVYVVPWGAHDAGGLTLARAF